MSPYTQENLIKDLEQISHLAASSKPTSPLDAEQWEMARMHKALVQFWVQVQKQFNTSAPTEDADNYFGFAKEWIRMIEIHHQLEEEVQFPAWEPTNNMKKNREEHEELMVPLRVFKAYVESVSSGNEAWSGTKAEELAQGFLPILMHHFVEELYTLDPEHLRRTGVTEDVLKASRSGVGARSKELIDPTRDVPALITHNDGALDWPPLPWQLTAEFKLPPQLYDAHKGWWKYSALP